MEVECIGCGRKFEARDGGTLCYTCPCGATTFIIDGKLAPLCNLVLGIAEKRELPHLNYHVGLSNHTSPIKDQLIKELKERGSIWSWECDECREKFLKRQKMLVEEGLSQLESLHPDLRTLISTLAKKRLKKVEKDISALENNVIKKEIAIKKLVKEIHGQKTIHKIHN